MNIPLPGARKPTSRLLEILRGMATSGAPGRVGFRAHNEVRKRKIGIIAHVAISDSESIQSASAAGADALEFVLSDRASLERLTELRQSLELPIGVLVPSDTAPDLSAAAAASGVDWLRFGLDASLLHLGDEQPARFLTVSPDLDLRAAVALNSHIADAAVVSVDSAPLTIGAGLRVRALCDILQKPVLALLPEGVLLPEAVLLSLGLDGLVLHIASAGDMKHLSTYAQILGTSANA